MKKRFYLITLISIIVTSCSVTKNIPQGQYLLISNDIKISYGDSVSRKMRVDRGGLYDLIPPSQVPNNRFLGMNISAWIYNQADTTNTWWNRTLRRIGRAPVLYDSIQTQKALENIKRDMYSQGFYNAQVSDSVYYKKRKKAYVVYNIDAGIPYMIGSYKYNFQDSVVMPYILTISKESVIKPGEVLKRSTLEEERNRITKALKNDGFYAFSVNSINYLIDTVSYNAAVTINIEPRTIDRKKVDHELYRVGSITVRSTNRLFSSFDTHKHLSKIDTIRFNNVDYIYPKGVRGVKPKRLSNLIMLATGDLCRLDNVEKTNNRLNSLGYYRIVNIAFTETEASKKRLAKERSILNKQRKLDNLYGVLDCDITLSQEMLQGFKAEAEVSTSSNFTGFSITLGYTNKNIFGGAEILSLSATGGYDFMSRNTNFSDSWEIGGLASITFPRLLSPFKLSRFKELNNISTIVEASINSQKRPYYDRTISSIAYGYSWNNGSKFSYMYRPVTVSFLYVPRVESSYLETITNPYLENSYESQLIAGSTFSLGYVNTKRKNKYNVRSNIETSGNLLYLGSYVFNAKHSDKILGNTNITEQYYKIFNVRYAQYVRADVNFSYEHKFNNKFTLAYRLYGGYGIAYGNSNTLPFERLFFCGGGNSMRGWQVRTLGPGDTSDDAKVETSGKYKYPSQLGNIKLETNLEARFAIYKVLYGALFFDLGNIWANGKGETNKAGMFHFNTFYKQLGFNTGLGLRLDFNFFVVRMDWGIQLHNPGFAKGHRWIHNFDLSNTALHFAIGYPF